MMVAHAIVGSLLWRVDVEKQRAVSDTIAESVEVSASEATFDAKRREVLALLGFDPELLLLAQDRADREENLLHEGAGM